MRFTLGQALFVLILLVAGGVVAEFVMPSLLHRWEIQRRTDEIRRYDGVVRAIAADHGNTELYEQLTIARQYPDAWDRTQMFAQMSQLESILPRTQSSKAAFLSTLLPVIRQGLHDPSGFVRREAALAAAAFAPWTTPAIPDLISVLHRYPNEDTALFAAIALGNIGPAASRALPALQQVKKDWPFCRKDVEQAIANISRHTLPSR